MEAALPTCESARLVRLLGTVALIAFVLLPTAKAQTPPDWVRDAVFYQIFPERFANGDTSNDPTWASLDFNDRVSEASWTVSEWTAEWYARQPWEVEAGPSFYEDGVFFRRYGGDLQGVLDRIDYIDSLGVNAVYFNPVLYAASLHKYDATSFHHIDPYFGPDPDGDIALIATETADPGTWNWTEADKLFLRLLETFHARGIRVVIDGVFNHTGTRFWAFADVAKNQQASPYADWYEITTWDNPQTSPNEFDWNGWWGFKPLAVLANNADTTDLNPHVKAHIFDITRRWMDPDGDGDPSDGIDGWRLDVSEEVPAGFWRDWNVLVRTLNPNAYTVSEVWGDASEYLAQTGFDATMNYHAVAIPADAFLYDNRISASAFADDVISRLAAYADANRFALLNLLDSHDTDRLASMIVNGGLGAHYDRDAGPRSNAAYQVRAPNAQERNLQRMATTFLMSLPGAPMLYYGTEAGMWGADDPDDRKPMVWPDLAYEDEALDPVGRPRQVDSVAFDSSLFRFHQDLIALRKGDPVLRSGGLRLIAVSDEAQSLAFERYVSGGAGGNSGTRRVVALNRSDENQFLQLPGEGIPGPLVPMFSSAGNAGSIPMLVAAVGEEDIVYGLRIPARSAVIFRPAEPDDVRPKGVAE